jgi:hypothetical protein
MIRVTLCTRFPGDTLPSAFETLWIGNLGSIGDGRAEYDYCFGPAGSAREPDAHQPWVRLPGSHRRADGVWPLLRRVLAVAQARSEKRPIAFQTATIDLISGGFGEPALIGSLEIEPTTSGQGYAWRYRTFVTDEAGHQALIGPDRLVTESPDAGWPLIRQVLRQLDLAPVG